jgi:hypothetical protein
LYLQNPKTKRIWFILDQLFAFGGHWRICLLWYKVDFTKYEIDNRFGFTQPLLLLLTTPASIVIKK